MSRYIFFRSLPFFLCKAEQLISVITDSIVLRFSMNESKEKHLLSDAKIVRLAKNDEEYFTELFDRYFPRVYRFYYSRLRVRQDAEDLTSELFLKAFTKLGSYTDQGVPFSAWLFSIARNTLIDYVRKQKLQPILFDEPPRSAAFHQAFDMEKINTKLCREYLWKAISTLPEKQQQLWALKLGGDLPHKDIAVILETSVNNIDVMTSRSFAVLKRRLAFFSSNPL